MLHMDRWIYRTDIPAKVSTSRDVKSGARKLSFSKSLAQGSRGIRSGDAFTRPEKALVRSTDRCVRLRISTDGLGEKLTVDDCRIR
jgi:hypothetical protein